MIKMVSVAVAICTILIGAQQCLAGFGNGVMDGTGPQCPFLNGTPVTVSGTVVSCEPQEGIVIDTGTEQITVFGLGPSWYWEANGVSKPDTGELISVEGIEVTLSDGNTRIVAVSITVSGETVVLRNSTTGVPLWRGEGGKSLGSGAARSQGMYPD